VQLSPFHAYYKARLLENLTGSDKIIPAFASSDIEVYPYQVAAATFALRSPYLRGAILCDDGSLGKSFEALLIITQRWYEGKRRILIVVPTPLLHQWKQIIDNRFSMPLYSIDSNADFGERIKNGEANPFEQDGIIITTYDFAAEKAEYISRIEWNLSVFEEAHHLRRIYTGENKGAAVIREAVGGSFKLLLTATPMQNSIMDLYGLIYFIDETALPDADSFYKRYFRKPENYAELADRISKFCFRTMRPQVATYVKIPERLPMTVDYTPSKQEQQLADMVDAYLARDKKYAYPKMELYDLTLMLYRLLSSSTFALAKTLQGVEKRLAGMVEGSDDKKLIDEHSHIKAMLALANNITENAKGAELLTALKKGFAELKRLGANKKALIFTENLETQKYLYDLLNKGEYAGKVLTFNGDYSRDYTVMERFEKEATILITTDIAAEGFNLEFCAFVVNYDLPYNTLKIEQRINRCHRQGQQTDVLVVNFLNRNNFADVRMLELINKRILQYDGIIGLSDDVIGSLNVNINRDFGKILSAARSKDEIDKAFAEILTAYEPENKQLVESAEQILFTSFNKDIADSVTVSPQYIEQRVQEINAELWTLAKGFFENYNEKHTDNGFDIDEQAKTITARNELPHLFYYWTGSRNKPYTSLRSYGLAQNFKPASGRITLSSVIGRGVIKEIECADRGTVTVDANIEPCSIALYCVEVRSNNRDVEYDGAEFVTLAGKTDSDRVLSDEDCRYIMGLPVLSFTEDGNKNARWLRESTGRGFSVDLDKLVSPDEYTRRAIADMDGAIREEIERLKVLTQDKKVGLERDIETLRGEVKTLTSGTGRANSIAEKVQAEKRKTAAQRELKQREQQLFLDGMRLDVELEEQIKRLTDEAKLTAVVKRQFIIRVSGGNHNG